MARIGRMFWNLTQGTPHPSEVEAELREVRTDGGEKLLQLSTFGSVDRQSRPKVSQTIQLDKEHAIELRCAIDKLFPREKLLDG